MGEGVWGGDFSESINFKKKIINKLNDTLTELRNNVIKTNVINDFHLTILIR